MVDGVPAFDGLRAEDKLAAGVPARAAPTAAPAPAVGAAGTGVCVLLPHDVTMSAPAITMAAGVYRVMVPVMHASPS